MQVRSSLRARILAAFLLSTTSLALAVGYGLYQLRSIGEGLEVQEAGYLPLAKVATRLETIRARDPIVPLQTDDSIGVTPIPDRILQDAIIENDQRIRELTQDGRDIVSRALLLAPQPEEIAVLTSLDRQLVLIVEAQEVYQGLLLRTRLMNESGKGELVKNLEVDRNAARQRLDQEVDQLTHRVDDSIVRVSTQSSAAWERSLVASASLGLLALGLGLAMLALAALSLRPIGRLTEEVQRIARGDYGTRLEVRRRDELGILAEEVNAMATSIEQRDVVLRARTQEIDGARARLSSVLDAFELGVVVVDEEIVSMSNPAARSFWNVDEGRTLPSVLRFEGDRAEAVEIGDCTFDLSCVPFGAGVIIVGEDVTQRLRVRERLLRSERLALVGQMLAQITHEVRNPLNAMSLNAELLDEELQALPADRHGEAQEILGTLTSEIRRLEEVTGHYLDLARRPRPSIEPTALVPLVEELSRLLGEELRRGEVELELDLQDVGEVPADGNQLRRALHNVIRNAAEAGASIISITLERADTDVLLEIRDDGPGMDQETARHALEPFFSTKAKGTGLGLAITRQIIEDHGGNLRIESLEEGSKIVFTFPGM